MQTIYRAIFILAAIICPAVAQTEECVELLQTTVSPIGMDNLIQQLSKVPNVKDEFETTAEYDVRVQRSVGALPAKFIVETPIDSKYIEYDADAQTLGVRPYAIDNINIRYDGVFGYGTPMYGKVKYVGSQLIDVVVSKSEQSAGVYKATNSFGASISVEKIIRFTKAIFDRVAEEDEDLFFPSRRRAPNRSDFIIRFPGTSPSVAKTVKATMRAALVVVPKFPFYSIGKINWRMPTFQAPVDIDETLEVIVADIQCVLLTDEKGKVFAAIPTR